VNDVQTIKQRFEELDGERRTILDRKRECAEYTHPIVLPPESYTDQDELDTPLNSAPAIGSTALAAKIANSVLPTNGSSIVTPEIPVPSGVPDNVIEMVTNTITAYDRQVMAYLQSSNFRSQLHDISLDLVVVGDALLEMLPNGQYRKHRLDNYVVVRKEDGSIHELIIRVWVDPKTLDTEYQNRVGPSEVQAGSRRLEPKFIKVCWETDRYYVTEEFRGVSKNIGDYLVLPYFALKTGGSASDNYGRSIIESLLGDIRSLMAHSLALLQGSAANSEFRLCVDPQGVTEMPHMANSVNGQWVTARAQDIHVMQLGNPVQVQITMAAVEKYEAAILRALLYDLVYAGQNRDRVTATEINATIQAIESGLSGLLSSITQELHIPLVRRLSVKMAMDEQLDEPVRAIAQNVVSGNAPLRLRSGIEALHREIKAMRLVQAVNIMSTMPPQASTDVKWANVVFDLMAGFGFEGARYLLTAEEKQQAALQQASMNVAEQTGIAAGQQAVSAQGV
jgi:hypothetical protein